jgi:hypothetical protein
MNLGTAGDGCAGVRRGDSVGWRGCRRGGSAGGRAGAATAACAAVRARRGRGRPHPDEGYAELLIELVDAHVDTIELVVCGGDATAWPAHLRYLQRLVRESKWLMAHAAGDPRAG